MTKSTSPFMVFRDFLSPKQCEQITHKLNFFYPDTDENGTPIKSIKTNEYCEELIFYKWKTIIPDITAHYGIEYKGTENIIFEWFPTGSTGTPVCENSVYIGKKWTRVNQRDISAVLFLNDYNDQPDFDAEYETYGGKLEFPSHRFGFNPKRGTLIVYPSAPHFINVTAQVEAGELIQARIQMAATSTYMYNPKNFPGDFSTWFKNIS